MKLLSEGMSVTLLGGTPMFFLKRAYEMPRPHGPVEVMEAVEDIDRITAAGLDELRASADVKAGRCLQRIAETA